MESIKNNLGGKMEKIMTIKEMQKKLQEMEEKIQDIKLQRMGCKLDTSTPGEISIIRNNYHK